MTELKPCPFCGAQPEQWEEEPDRMWRPYFIGCTNVDCLCDVCVQRASEEEAVADWNTRAERTCHNASYRLDESRFHCSECGYGCWVKDVADGRDKLPSYCPNCGARVIGGNE